MTSHRDAAVEARRALEDYEEKRDAVAELAAASGQEDPSIPLVIEDWDSELGIAVKAEAESHQQMVAAMVAMAAARPVVGEGH